MRLIDADKLLEAFSNSKHIKETTSGLNVMEMLVIKEIIDNAETYNQVGHRMATAEGFITDPEWPSGFKAGYKQAILDGQTNSKRQQGTWKVKNFDEETGISDSCWCPFCGMAKAQVYNNFCGNCGADMRGDEE